MSVAFGEPSLAVDTHVERVSKRLVLIDGKTMLDKLRIVFVISSHVKDGIEVIINLFSLEDIIV